MAKTLYLMRHGQTLFNQLGLVQGAVDSPLTKLGQEQARLAGLYFKQKGISFDQVYSSTQERASDTATLVTGREPIRLKGIKEWHFGAFEAQPERLQPKVLEGEQSFGRSFVPYGGEDVSQVGQRVKQTVANLLKQSADDETLLAVSHGGAMWALIVELGIPIKRKSIAFTNCVICQYEYEQHELHLKHIIDPIGGKIYPIPHSLD